MLALTTRCSEGFPALNLRYLEKYVVVYIFIDGARNAVFLILSFRLYLRGCDLKEYVIYCERECSCTNAIKYNMNI